MTNSKTSTALLAVWVLLIASLVGVAVFLYLKTRPETPPEDAATVPVAPVKPKVPPKPPLGPRSQRGGAASESASHPKQSRRPEIHGVVHSPTGEPVAGAKINVFAPTRPNQGKTPATPPNMDEIRKINEVLYVETSDFDSPRPLSQWTAGPDLSRSDDKPLATAETAADGTFSVSVNPGPARLTASKEGVGSAAMNGVQPGPEKVEMTLGPASSVSGLVLTDVDSVPVDAARVTFDNGNRVFSATTDSSGHFTADGVTPGQYVLTVSAKDRTPLMEQHFRIEANDANPITLRMPRGTLLRIKALLQKEGSVVVNPKTRRKEITGDPIPNAEVFALCTETLAYVSGTTDPSGVVEFKGLPAGQWQVGGIAAGYKQSGEVGIRIDKNQLTMEDTLEFDVAVETTVEVVDEDGRPLAGVEFWGVNSDDAYDQVRSSKVGVTDQDGKMKMVFDSDGPRRSVFGFKSGYAIVHVSDSDVSEPTDPVKLVAKKGIRVHGVVKTPDGKPIAGAIVEVSISPADLPDFLTLDFVADSEGRYDFPNLPRSDGISLTAKNADGDESEDQDVEVTQGKNDYVADFVIDASDAEPIKATPGRKPVGPTPNMPGK